MLIVVIDAYAAQLGYAESLGSMLEKGMRGEEVTDQWASLLNSKHPPTNMRISRLKLIT
jgi:Zn-dependent protease with chaperone function